MSIFYAILIFVGVCVGISLAWFLIELVLTIRKTRKKIDEVHAQLTPTIDNIEAITTKIQPAIDKVDPLIERVSLTIDAANLELMRADQILENVNQITEGVSTATTAVGNIANAPSELIGRASRKISGLFFGGRKKVAGELEGGNVNKVLTQGAKQNKKFGRKISRNDVTNNQYVQNPQNVAGYQNPQNANMDSGNNPFVSFN